MSLTPKPSAVLPPNTLESLAKPTWNYLDAEHLAESGIYSTDDLNRLREHIMFPVEPTLMNNLTKAAAGERVPLKGLSIANLLDNNAIDIIIESTSNRIFKGFLKFGTYCAGFIGAWTIFKTLKIVVDTMIHGYAFHSIYGWSVHLLRACFSSLTALLLYLGRKSTTTTTYENNGSNQFGGPTEIGPPVKLSSTVIEILEPMILLPATSRHESSRRSPVPHPRTTIEVAEPHLYPQIAIELTALSRLLSNIEERVNQRLSTSPNQPNNGVFGGAN